ncbi:MAG: DUF3298 domain-containing protein [Paludibacteraceae bacterium]|nr:DUF3298 domain-containing protein [Paludibacteraceae bacterium]
MKKYLFIVLCFVAALTSCNKHEFRTEQIKYNKTYIAENGSDSLVIAIDIEYPVDMENESALVAIQTDLLKILLDNEVNPNDGEKAIREYAQKFEEGYKKEYRPELSNDLGLFCWENYINGKVISVQNNILTYCDERYVFLGGPHGNNQRHFYNYDMQSGKCLTETDFFVEGFEKDLTQLLVSNMIEEIDEFESIRDLNESPYDMDEIKPNHNFYFTDKELIYVFNPYEIGPYYLGETEVSIPLSQVGSLLRAEYKAAE